MENKINPAPGAPGIEPKWTTSKKSGIGTSITAHSRVWFTLSHGIINEVYYPKIDRACTRDFEFIVTDGKEFFSEEKRDTKSETKLIKEGVPAYHVTNRCENEKYILDKRIITDPDDEVLIQHIKFNPLVNKLSEYHLYALLAPHVGNKGFENSALVDEYKGVQMIFANRGSTWLALSCSAGWLKRSVGYVGFSDGWQDTKKHSVMEWEYTIANNGNVAMMGEIDINSCGGDFTIAIGFGQSKEAAGFRVLNSLRKDFKNIEQNYIAGWKDWFKNINGQKKNERLSSKEKFSAAVIKIHEDKSFQGGFIASLSIPWGSTKGDEDLGGYHLVWIRDLVECASGLLAAGVNDDAIKILNYLRATQEDDGHWPQNMWLDGGNYWKGIQMDEVAFPILLLEQIFRNKLISKNELKLYYKMMQNALSYIVKNGPVTEQDRWEEDSGYSPFTLSVEIAALLSGAYLLDKLNDRESAKYLKNLADYWNDSIEKWCYVRNTDIANENNIEGYYVRIAPEEISDAASPIAGFVPIKNRPPGMSSEKAYHIISVDALALVRFGLRKANDPKILNTLKVIDKYLKIETQYGPAWYRYNNDGYGEHDDGSDFDGIGTGRAWPLLVGERAHYEISAGNYEAANKLFNTLESFSNDAGLIPEQIWDSIDIPQKDLFLGKPTGSAMPLAWAHAEHLKLIRSIKEKKIFDMPNETYNRYIKKNICSKYICWRTNNKIKSIEESKILRIDVPLKANIHWTSDDWKSSSDNETNQTIFGMYYFDINLSNLKDTQRIQFTIYWSDKKKWEGTNYIVNILKLN